MRSPAEDTVTDEIDRALAASAFPRLRRRAWVGGLTGIAIACCFEFSIAIHFFMEDRLQELSWREEGNTLLIGVGAGIFLAATYPKIVWWIAGLLLALPVLLNLMGALFMSDEWAERLTHLFMLGVSLLLIKPIVWLKGWGEVESDATESVRLQKWDEFWLRASFFVYMARLSRNLLYDAWSWLISQFG